MTPAPRREPPPRSGDSRLQIGVALAVGVLVGGAVAIVAPNEFAPLAGWDAAALTYLVWVWWMIHGADARHTADLALTENPARATADAILLGSAVVSLAAVAFVLAAANSGGASKLLHAGAAVVSVILSWFLVHTVHTLTYARLYYAAGGGVDFNTSSPPTYVEFAYLSFTIGMTFQVSDTELQNTKMRRVALRHALLSYLFGAVVIATTINLVVGLSK